MERVFDEYFESLIDTDKEKALSIIFRELENGILAERLLFHVVVPSIDKMLREVHETQNTNLDQHFITAQIASEVMEILIPRFEIVPEVEGTIVIGTSLGDFHGLGKKIVSGCLKAHLINVVDLGLSVCAEKFVDEAIANNAQVIAISSMMVHTASGENGCLKVRQILKENKLEDKIKITVGGAPYRYDHDLWKMVQADTWSETGIEACGVISDLIRGVRANECN